MQVDMTACLGFWFTVLTQFRLQKLTRLSLFNIYGSFCRHVQTIKVSHEYVLHTKHFDDCTVCATRLIKERDMS